METQQKALSENMQLMLTADEAEQVRKAAQADDRPVSAWLRLAVRKELERHKSERKGTK